MPTVLELLKQAKSSLPGPESRQEAEALMQAVCGIDRSQQFSHPEKELSSEQAELYMAALKRRLHGEPVAHITGRRGFWDMELRVTADVLIPRPDTECLVEQALARIPPDADWQIADLGTGSGAIALAIARERPSCHLTATDISAAALNIARENATELVTKNIDFSEGPWGRVLQADVYDMIVSNPPYIRADDPHLEQGDLPAEPESALISGADGLEDIRQIITDSVPALRPGGWLLLEHGYDQAAKVAELMQKAGFKEVFKKQDYGANDRVTGGKKT